MTPMLMRVVCLSLLLTTAGCSSQLPTFDASKIKMNVDGDNSAYKVGVAQPI
jgi:hypothetical protein